MAIKAIVTNQEKYSTIESVDFEQTLEVEGLTNNYQGGKGILKITFKDGR